MSSTDKFSFGHDPFRWENISYDIEWLPIWRGFSEDWARYDLFAEIFMGFAWIKYQTRI